MKNTKENRPILKQALMDGKKIASHAMIENGDFLYLKDDGYTVGRTWGGNEGMVGDKYFQWDLNNEEWKILD